MRLKTDREGLESLPLKLMIVAIVASLSIFPAAQGLDSLRNKDFVSRSELQLDNIISVAEILAIGGPGGTRTIQLDFSSEGSLQFERIIIGDKAGANMSSVILSFTNGAQMIKTCTDPQVWIRTEDGSGLVIQSFDFDIKMSAMIEGATEYVLVEVV